MTLKTTPAVATGLLVISRTTQSLNYLRKFSVWIDGNRVGSIANGATQRFALAAGQHTIFVKIDWCMSDKVTADFKTGKPVELVCGSDFTGWKLLLACLYFLSGKYIYLRRTVPRV
ncbi:MAG TPA: hypothetical protein VGP76_02140 [Planctomycetaceae bacterium]|jgi:hypothetical protein|nr:hypothetical protein [Planctomycetaceae bacterium]